MAPRRPRASSNANQHPLTKNGPRRPDSTVPAFAGALIDPETRYEHNLKVVRRRDQSIIRIFDQFSHVVVYEHDQESKKWQKKGYEGAMFLFERQLEPRYGFYILNRGGKEDWMQLLYPWDDFQLNPQYVFLCSYPDYTEAHLSGNLPPPPPNPSDPHAARKSTRKLVIGLWMFKMQDLHTTISRLLTCVQQGVPYPDEFKYQYAIAPRSSENESGSQASPSLHHASPSLSSAPTPAMGLIDQLFVNASKTSSPAAPVRSPQQARRHQVAPSASALPTMGSSTSSTLDALFASAAAAPQQPVPLPASARVLPQPPGHLATPHMASPQHNVASVPPPQPQGPALLDSLFASAAAPIVPQHPSFSTFDSAIQSQVPPLGFQPQAQYYQPSSTGEMNQAFRFPHASVPRSPPEQQRYTQPVILSPKPQTTGLPPLLGSLFSNGHAGGSESSTDGSRTSSAASSASSGGSYVIQGKGIGMCIVDEAAEERAASRGVRPQAALSAEATPRASASDLPTMPGMPSLLQQIFSSNSGTTTPSASISVASATSSAPALDAQLGMSARPAPTLADAAPVWLADTADVDTSEEIIELDFSDTRALADPTAFKSAQAKTKAKKQPTPKATVPSSPSIPISPAANGHTLKSAHLPPGPGSILSSQASASAPLAAATLQNPLNKATSTPVSPINSMMFVPAQVKQSAKAPPKVVNGLHASNKSIANGHSPSMALNHVSPLNGPASPALSTHMTHSPHMARSGAAVNGHSNRMSANWVVPPVNGLPSSGMTDGMHVNQHVLRHSVVDNLFSSTASARLAPGLSRDQLGMVLHRLVETDPAFLTGVWEDYMVKTAAHT